MFLGVVAHRWYFCEWGRKIVSLYLLFMLEPSKPSRIGLWMYQLVAQLGNALPILIYMRMMAVESVRSEHASVHDVVRAWRDIILKYLGHCILVFDSYYFSSDSVTVLEEPLPNGRPSRVKFVGAVTASKLPLCDVFQGRVNIPGQWDGLYHSSSGQLLINYYDVDAKYVMSNAYTQVKRPENQCVVPVYDDYRVLFDKCDKFNRSLYHCTWSHKSGGRDVIGDRGSQHNFAMSYMLQNIFDFWFQANMVDHSSVDFSTNCLLLADEIYAYATTLAE